MYGGEGTKRATSKLTLQACVIWQKIPKNICRLRIYDVGLKYDLCAPVLCRQQIITDFHYVLSGAAAMSKRIRFFRHEEGATAVEYAVMVALIIAVCIGAITLVGGGTYDFWENNRTRLESSFSGS